MHPRSGNSVWAPIQTIITKWNSIQLVPLAGLGVLNLIMRCDSTSACFQDWIFTLGGYSI